MMQPEAYFPAFNHSRDRQRFWLVWGGILILGILFSVGLLCFRQPVPMDSPSFYPVIKRRAMAVLTIIVVAICQSISTIAFQTLSHNRMVTPSLLGFPSLYIAIHTVLVFFGGVQSLIQMSSTVLFIMQLVIMIMVSLLLYQTLLTGKYGSMDVMLLVGVMLGMGLNSLATFMRRVLSPSEFDILQARLFASVNHADGEQLLLALPFLVLATWGLFKLSSQLNALSLGEDTAKNLGINTGQITRRTLIYITILMAISTALMGPLSFFGFLVANLCYQWVPSYDHRYLFMMSIVLAFAFLSGAYFILTHLFHAQGVVSIVIELVGGIGFLMTFFRSKKGGLA